MKKLYTTLVAVLAIVNISYGQFVAGATGYTVLTNINDKVGIGTSTPANKLDVVGVVNSSSYMSATQGLYTEITKSGFNNNAGTGYLSFRSNNVDNRMVIDPNGYVGIGTTAPSQQLEVFRNEVIGSPTDVLYPIVINRGWNSNGGTSTSRNTGLLFKDVNSIEAGVQAVRENSSGNYNSGMAFLVNTGVSGLVPTTSLTEAMRISSAGFVGIGTPTPKEALSVNGNIRSKQIKVETANWPDYVFKNDYSLPSLSDLKTYIDQNQHLPEMPSESDVAKDGINLGEMVKLQTKKIEELTLYLIDKDKTDKEKDAKLQLQQKQIEDQQRINQSLQEQINKIAKKLNN